MKRRPAAAKSAGDVIVYLRGGVVQDVVGNRKGLRVLLVDHDQEAREPVSDRQFRPATYAPDFFAQTLAETEE